jgi:hypothetical protein
MVQVSNADEEDEHKVSKLLTVRPAIARIFGRLLTTPQISYIISPILAFTVVGSLRASQAAMGT